MKNIVNFLLICFIFFSNINLLYSWFIICDSGNINLSWNTEVDICNWWFINSEINNIETFTWKVINYKLWFWWTNNDSTLDIDIENNLPIWLFDNNKRTVVTNSNPKYESKVWFLWINNNYNLDKHNEVNLPIWFFNKNIQTFLINSNPDYLFPTWYLWNHTFILKKKKKFSRWINIIDNTTYKEYFILVFKKYSKIKYARWGYKHYEISEYYKFIENLVNLYGKWYNNYDDKISQNAKNRIEWYIEKDINFKKNLYKLTGYLREINYSFDNSKNDIQKKYIIKFYLNK